MDIVVGGSIITFEGLQKAIACGVNAVVVGGFDDADRMALLLTSRCETGSFCQKMLAVYVL